MHKTLILTAVVAGLACTAIAFAASNKAPHEIHQGHPSIDRTDSGTITALNADLHTITLGDGVTYSVPPYVNFGSFQTGQHVSVLYTYYLDQNYITVKNVRAE